MKERTKKTLEQIEAAHDWREGQTWGHGGTSYSQTDVCRWCGLRRLWTMDEQNGHGPEYTFSSHEGEPLPLCAVPVTCDGAT